jgi:hypothetical protein
MSASRGRDRGLIFGLIRVRSSSFIGIQSDAAMQVTNVSVIRRTIIQTSENRKVDGSTPPPATCTVGLQIGSYEEEISLSSFSSSDGVIRARYTCSVVISAVQLAASSA